MTAYAVRFDPQRIVIASDTLGYVPARDGEAKPIGFSTKVLPLAHHRAAIFSRGMLQVAVTAAAAIALSPQLTDFDAVAEALPERLRIATGVYADEHDIDDADDLFIAEVVLAGWSQREHRMRLVYMLNANGYEPQSDDGTEYGRILTMPRLPPEYTPPTAGLPLDRQLVEHMKAHRRWFADVPALMHGAIIGGEIVITEITPQGVAQRIVHRFEDADAVGHAAAAVAARLIRDGIEDIYIGDALTPMADTVDAGASMDRAAGHRADKLGRRADKLARRADRARRSAA